MVDVQKFIRDGWVIVDIHNPLIVRKIISDLSDFSEVSLRYIHQHYDNEATKKLHAKLSKHTWEREYSMEIAMALLPVVQQLVGLDVMVQYLPYLRIARPNKRDDNIGYHKDTQYGQNPYEIAVHIPFVDLDEKSAIRVISGSHVMPEDRFTRVTADGARVEKGSLENHMGRPYLPKCLSIPDGMTATPLVMHVGQAAIFSPAIFHGQEVNEGVATRVSADLRFIGARAPVEIRQGKTHAGYVPVASSPVEQIAKKYYGAQK